MNSRRVLVTGGAGFIGSQVAAAYVERGDRVWVVDNLSTGKRTNVPEGATFIETSIGDAGLDDVFRDAGGFDLVNHHAAQIDVRISVNDPRRDARTNIDGFLNVAECALRHATRRFVFVSSGGVVYGEPDVVPTPETAPKGPLSPYGVSKLTAEYYLQYYQQVHGLDYVALRYSNVYGPRQDPHGEAGVVAIFASRLLADEPLTIFGDGEQTRDYVFVGDVVRANLLFGDAALRPPGVLDDRGINIATGVATSVTSLAMTLADAVGREATLMHKDARPGEVRESVLDIRKARGLGWSPQTSLKDGLGRTFEWIAAASEAVR
jgi:UDP-glucose 4-epimerase